MEGHKYKGLMVCCRYCTEYHHKDMFSSSPWLVAPCDLGKPARMEWSPARAHTLFKLSQTHTYTIQTEPHTHTLRPSMRENDLMKKALGLDHSLVQMNLLVFRTNKQKVLLKCIWRKWLVEDMQDIEGWRKISGVMMGKQWRKG